MLHYLTPRALALVRARRIVPVALAAILAALSAGASSARAGDYPMVLCGDAGTHRAGDWVSAVGMFNDCAQGAAIGLRNTTLAPRERIAMITAAPGAIRIVSSDLSAALFGDVNVGADPAQRLTVDMAVDGSRVYNTDLVHASGWNRIRDRVRLSFAPAQRFELGASCGGNSTNPCSIYNAGQEFVGIFAATFTLRENVPPVANNVGGNAAQDEIDGKQILSLDATDADSGVKQIAVLLDDKTVATGDYSGECVYDSYRPCPGVKANAELAVDTTAVPDGPHQLRVAVADGAGNVTTRTIKTVMVDNVPDPRPGQPGGPALEPGPAYQLHAAWLRNRKRDMVVGYRSAATLTGSLRNPDGTPLAGGILTISALPLGDSSPKSVQATTTASGGWRVKVSGRTRPQTVAVNYKPNPAEQGVGVLLSLTTRAKVTLTASRHSVGRRGSVRFAGRLYARGIPPRGVLVELQVRIPGSRTWRTFRAVRTKSTGRFATRYRFKRTPPGTRYAFRARYRDQANVPYATGHSHTLAVKIR